MSLPYSNIQSGDILAVSDNTHWYNPLTWFAWRIQADTDSPWNHVGLMKWIDGKLYVIESKCDGGVAKNDPADYLDGNHRIALARPSWINESQQNTAAAYAYQQIGRGYDIGKILKIRALQLILGHDVADGIQSEEHDNVFICSELVIRAWKAAGHKLGGSYAGPGEVMKHCTIYWDSAK